MADIWWLALVVVALVSATGLLIHYFPSRDRDERIVRGQVTHLTADSLLQAAQIIGQSSSALTSTLSENLTALQTYGPAVQRTIDRLVAEWAEIPTQMQGLRQAVQELTDAIRALPKAGSRPVVTVEDGLDETLPSDRTPVPPPCLRAARRQATPESTAFSPECPLKLLVADVSSCEQLAQIEDALSRIEVVRVVSSESYQDGQASFLLSLEQPLAVEHLRTALLVQLGGSVGVEALEPSLGKIALRPEAPTDQVDWSSRVWA